MTAKEKLKNICSKCEIAKGKRQIACPFRSIDNEYCDDYDIIKQSLDRLEKLEKVIEILKKKKVNIYHIWAFDNYQQYKEHYPFSEYHAEEDMLTEQEYEQIKKVLEEYENT